LRVEAGELDLERFETLLDRARQACEAGDPETAGSDLREALSLFRGAPLEDLVHAPFAQAEIGRLEDLRLSALERRLEADLAVGRHADVVGELESLTERHPFREVLWRQLMLALYRSGRQGEALLAFDRARRTFAEELGIDPGPPLKQLHRQILQQDPSLERDTPSVASAALATATAAPPAGLTTRSEEAPPQPAASEPLMIGPPPTTPPRGDGRRRRGRFRAGPRAVAVGVGLGLAVTALGIFVPRLLGRGDDAPATYRPGTVLIELESGNEIASIPRSRLAVAAYPIFAGGHFWVNNWSPNAYVQIDPKTGAILNEISPPARDPNVTRDFETITPFAVQGNTLWVNSADDLVKMDIGLGREVDRFELDDLGEGAGVAEGVAVGGGSLWVSRSVGRGQILRLDPVTGRPEHVWNNVTPYLNLAYGDGSLWVADERGIARIDPQTNLRTPVSGIEGNCGGGGGGCVVAGGDWGWTSHDAKGAVYKVDQAGHIAATYAIGIGAGFMSFSDGVLWAANYDEGTVTGIDAVTGKATETYRFGHPVGTMATGDGVLLADLNVGRPVENHISSLAGKVARFFAHPGELGDEEPALNVDPGAYQIEFATCAKLLNYRDKAPPEGWQLRPEVAAAMPTISPDGRTYRFTVRPGYRFSPPSNRPLTAETFRYSIERALSPKLAQNPTGRDPPGPHFIDDIEGEQAFRRGRAEHISGLRAGGDTLSITLTRPSPDFLKRLALPFFCPVPTGTPFVAGAPHRLGSNGEGYIVSAGPYHVADYNDGYVILKRNPNYRGPRPHAFDAIAIREKGDASAALDQIENEAWDGITSMFDPALEPGGFVDRRWGAESSAAPGAQRYFLTPESATRFIAFNGSRGIFADARVRRAAALAIDRGALAAAWGALPTDQLLSQGFPAYRNRELYPLSASIAKARALTEGRGGNALMAIPSGCAQCTEAAHVVRQNLGAVGIDVTIRSLDDLGAALESGAEFDLVDTSTALPYPDSASFLAHMFDDLPSGWVPVGVRARLERVAAKGGDGRQAAAASLADHLATVEAPVAAYGIPQTSQFIGPRIGCRVFSPFAYGLDLAAACINASSG
jgi:ABC-type transport system substrate-binding protein